MEEARIKMVGDASWAKESLISAIARLIKESGVFATFNGLPAMLSKQVDINIHTSVTVYNSGI